MTLSTIQLSTFLGTLGLATIVGIATKWRVRSAHDFAVGGRQMSALLVAGTIIGTLVGGASTIGTAQLAFTYGMSGWWYTLGGGLGCLVLGLLFAGPLRQAGVTTGPGFLATAYGPMAGVLGSLFSSVGILLNVVAQILSAVALLAPLFGLSTLTAACVTVGMMIAYVVFGGVWSVGLMGSFKSVLLYLAMLITGVMAYKLGGGWQGYTTSFAPYPWLSLLGRGVGPDVAAAFSMIIGVVSTQTYLQAICSGRDVQASRQGALLAAVLTPPVGVAGILAGLYMRTTAPDIPAREALPRFILTCLPDSVAGVILAALFVAAIGSGAGLVLGISTTFTEDMYKKVFPHISDRHTLWVSRLAVVGFTVLGLLFVTSSLNSFILE